MRNLTLEGRVVKIVFQPLINTIPNHIILELTSIQKDFIWQKSILRYETLRKAYQDGAL